MERDRIKRYEIVWGIRGVMTQEEQGGKEAESITITRLYQISIYTYNTQTHTYNIIEFFFEKN